ERPVARHLGHRILAVALHAVAQGVADAIPAGEAGAVLRPGEHPRDRAQVVDAALAPARGARADLQSLDHVHRRGGAEVVEEIRLLVHQRAIVRARCRGQIARDLLPAVLARIARARPQGRAQHRAGGLLEVAQGQRADAVLAVDHLALLGDAHRAVHRAAWRGHDRALGLAAAAAHRTATTVEEHDAH